MEINIKNVTKVIKGNTVIDHVSLDISSGVITGIKGINGSGKTMLLRLIAGLIQPTAGEIIIDGKYLWKDISFPESVGLLIENPAFLDHYNAFDNLKLLSDLNGRIGLAEITDILRSVSLDHAGRKKYKTFSLGMKQRLGVAAAFMEHPEIILLDEPTNALDSDGVEMIKRLLNREKERGALVVLTCHDFTMLKELSDVIYVMHEGKLDDRSII